MAETLKAVQRRKQFGFFDLYIHGSGLDIGAGDDPLTPDCDTFEKDNPDNGKPITSGIPFVGDAHKLEGVKRNFYNWVYASHVLEHMERPDFAIRTWFDCVAPMGVLVVCVPHRDLYEKKMLLPSRWNADHKTFWHPHYHEVPHTFGLRQFIEEHIKSTGPNELQYHIEYIAVCSEGHTITDPSVHSNGEYQIECVIRKLY